MLRSGKVIWKLLKDEEDQEDNITMDRADANNEEKEKEATSS